MSSSSSTSSSPLVQQIGLLALLQACLLTNNVTLIAVNGLAGLVLAPNKLLATLPVTSYVLGSAVFSILAAKFMQKHGRRKGYSVGALFAVGGAITAGWGVTVHSMSLLCLGTFITGVYTAFASSYRFAAAEFADSVQPSFRAKAISLVLTGGIVGGIVGPELSKLSRSFTSVNFAGTYFTLAGFALLTLVLVQFLRLPSMSGPANPAAAAPRSLREILRAPNAWVAVLSGALAYGVMNLLMVATPLAMAMCNLPYASAAFVLEWHIIGMFAPGLFTGNLITRFGVYRVMAVGCVLVLVCCVVALQGVDLMNFTVALALLGVGWNFMFTGATTLLTGAAAPNERAKLQGFNEMCIFGVMITSSLSSGVLLNSNGWNVLNWLSVPFILVVMAALWWLARQPTLGAAAKPA
jgi:MFS family permease